MMAQLSRKRPTSMKLSMTKLPFYFISITNRSDNILLILGECGISQDNFKKVEKITCTLCKILVSRTSVWEQVFLKMVQFSSVAQSCQTLCEPMNCSTPGLPVHHQLPEFTQTQIHQVGDAIQPSHPRSSPSPPAPNPSQHQSLFQ